MFGGSSHHVDVPTFLVVYMSVKCVFQWSARTRCDVLEYRNLTIRPVFTDWLIKFQVLWHLKNEVIIWH